MADRRGVVVRDVVIREGAAWVPLGVVVVLGLVLVVDALLRGDTGAALRAAAGGSAVAWLVAALLVRPCVVLSSDALVLVRVLRRVRLPWTAVADVRMRHQLVVDTVDGRTRTAWGGPALPRTGTRTASRTSAGAAIVLDAWEHADRDLAAAARRPEPGPVVSGWDVPGVAGLAIVVALVMAAVLVR